MWFAHQARKNLRHLHVQAVTARQERDAKVWNPWEPLTESDEDTETLLDEEKRQEGLHDFKPDL